MDVETVEAGAVVLGIDFPKSNENPDDIVVWEGAPKEPVGIFKLLSDVVGFPNTKVLLAVVEAAVVDAIDKLLELVDDAGCLVWDVDDEAPKENVELWPKAFDWRDDGAFEDVEPKT